MSLTDVITEYYKARDLKWPDAWEALAWAQTELGEVYELLLAQRGGWIRNNPSDKQSYSPNAFADELADALMMLIVAGMTRDVDPVEWLRHRLENEIAKS